MPAPKKKPEPDKPARRSPEARERRAVTPADRRISETIDELRIVQQPDLTRMDLARKAGLHDAHALRMFRTPRTGPQAGTIQPKQAWTMADLAAYAGALGVGVASILVAAGLQPVTMSVEESILADPTLPAAAKGSLITMVTALRPQAR